MENKILKALASLRVALSCMGLSIILVFWGTLAQVQLGTYNAQKVFFDSFVVFQKIGHVNVPVFPGGLSIGFLWLLNLSAAFIVRFRPTTNKMGLFISHAGLILLLAGQLLTQLYSIETQLPIQVGQSLNYSESSRDTELIVIDQSDPEFDEVTSIPISIVQKKGVIRPPLLPFELMVKEFFHNSELTIATQDETQANLKGIGNRIKALPLPPVTTDDQPNTVTAFIEIISQEENLGTWLVSSGLGAPQIFNVGGKTYEIRIQHRRTYVPFTLTLKEFNHDLYPGTNIPKNFSSLVQLTHPEKNEKRDVLIYMNHPLRYEGKTFYQASFGNNNTLSVFQVVENPFAPSPYIACGLMALGMAFHFLMTLRKFLKEPR
ncbi:MAG: cytochrome c biogenesis protein ResB [Elusimicrobiota bacterium]